MADGKLIPFGFFPVPREGENVTRQIIYVELAKRVGDTFQTVEIMEMTRQEYFDKYPTYGNSEALTT